MPAEMLARPVSLGRDDEPILVRQRVRWWSIAFIVGTSVALTVRCSGADGGRAIAELHGTVEAMEDEYSVAAGGGDQRRW